MLTKVNKKLTRSEVDQLLSNGIIKKITIAKKYYVHRDGYVINSFGRVLKYTISKHGYKRLHLIMNNGKSIVTTIHRLVALEFVSGRNSTKRIVNHIDGDKLNCKYDNLEWTTYKDNTKHATENNLLGYVFRLSVYDKRDNTTTIYPTIEDFGKYIKLHPSTFIRYIGTPDEYPLLGRFILRLVDSDKLNIDRNHGNASIVYIYDHILKEYRKLNALINASYLYGVNTSEVKKAFLRGKETHYVGGITFSKVKTFVPYAVQDTETPIRDRRNSWKRKILTMCTGLKVYDKINNVFKEFNTIKSSLSYLGIPETDSDKVVKLLYYNRSKGMPAIIGNYVVMRKCDNYKLEEYL